MGQVLHGSATTTEAVRRAIQHSQESLRALAGRYGINPKTVAKWKKRTSVADLPTGPKEPRSTVLSIEDEAIIVAFRKHTLLPLDDCLYALQPTIPHLTRSSLHRCLQRHGIGRLPDARRRQAREEGVQGLSDRLLPYRHRRGADRGRQALSLRRHRSDQQVRLRPASREGQPGDRLGLPHALVAAVPYKIHTVLTDNGIQFRLPPRYADGPTARFATHMFEMRCRENGIEHRFTKINHPWTNGQVERMNRTIKEATVQRYHYDSHQQLAQHLDDFVNAYNFGRRLKTLKGLTPYEFICKIWTSQPERFTLNPLHQMPGLNT